MPRPCSARHVWLIIIIIIIIWKKLKKKIKERREELRIENYKSKNMQSEHHKGFDMESHQWLKCNIDARKVSSIINMQEQMIETRGVESKQRAECNHRKLQIM